MLKFVGDYQKVMNGWLAEEGFSIGVGDCIQEAITPLRS